jgi:hypothetical protein
MRSATIAGVPLGRGSSSLSQICADPAALEKDRSLRGAQAWSAHDAFRDFHVPTTIKSCS